MTGYLAGARYVPLVRQAWKPTKTFCQTHTSTHPHHNGRMMTHRPTARALALPARLENDSIETRWLYQQPWLYPQQSWSHPQPRSYPQPHGGLQTYRTRLHLIATGVDSARVRYAGPRPLCPIAETEEEDEDEPRATS